MAGWESGAMTGGVGAAYISTDEGMVQILDADVRADEIERLMLDLGGVPMRASSSEFARPDANCSRVRVMHDTYPGVDILLGRQPIIDWMPAPRRPIEWRKPEIMAQLADQWHETQRAKMRRSA